MKLEEFVQQTLIDITNGVASAQEKSLLYVAPGYINNAKLTEPQFVKFEVGVTVNQEAGGGIRVFSLGDLKGQASSETTNRISFEVPVYFQAPTPLNDKHFSKTNEDV